MQCSENDQKITPPPPSSERKPCQWLLTSETEFWWKHHCTSKVYKHLHVVCQHKYE